MAFRLVHSVFDIGGPSQTPQQTNYLCVAADTKPTTGVPDGAMAYETDTGTHFIFDLIGAVDWIEYEGPVL